MAYDPDLAERVRAGIRSHPGISERRMFGGLAFMLDEHMAVGILGQSLMARIGPAFEGEALAMAHVRKMDFTGRPMKGYVFIDAAGLTSDDDLRWWIEKAASFIATLPPKPPRASGGAS